MEFVARQVGAILAVSLGAEPATIAALDDGSVITLDASSKPKVVVLHVIDLATAKQRRTLAVDASAYLHGEDGVQSQRGVLRAQAGTNNHLLLQVAGDASSRALALVVSLSTGQVIARIDAPGGTASPADWSCVGPTADGVLLRGRGPTVAGGTEIVEATFSGQAVRRYQLPGAARILADGATYSQ